MRLWDVIWSKESLKCILVKASLRNGSSKASMTDVVWSKQVWQMYSGQSKYKRCVYQTCMRQLFKAGMRDVRNLSSQASWNICLVKQM